MYMLKSVGLRVVIRMKLTVFYMHFCGIRSFSLWKYEICNMFVRNTITDCFCIGTIKPLLVTQGFIKYLKGYMYIYGF